MSERTVCLFFAIGWHVRQLDKELTKVHIKNPSTNKTFSYFLTMFLYVYIYFFCYKGHGHGNVVNYLDCIRRQFYRCVEISVMFVTILHFS